MVKCVNLNGIHRRIVQLSISLLQMLSMPTGPIDLLGNDSQRDRATAGALLVALWTNGCGQVRSCHLSFTVLNRTALKTSTGLSRRFP